MDCINLIAINVLTLTALKHIYSFYALIGEMNPDGYTMT